MRNDPPITTLEQIYPPPQRKQNSIQILNIAKSSGYLGNYITEGQQLSLLQTYLASSLYPLYIKTYV
jgi:hypothetical protein